MVEEEVAELGQQALERWQAGLEVSPENEEAAAEYTEILLATLFPSIGFAGMTEVGSKIAAKRALLTDAETEEHYKDYVKVQEALRKSEERLAAEEIEAEAERRDVGEDFRDRRGSFWLGRMQELAEGNETAPEKTPELEGTVAAQRGARAERGPRAGGRAHGAVRQRGGTREAA